MAQLLQNNLSGVLASGINAAAASMTLVDATNWPAPTGGDYYLVTLIGLNGNGQESLWEIVKVTAKASNTLTIVRAQESTSAASWPAATTVQMRLTAGSVIPGNVAKAGDTMTGALTATGFAGPLNGTVGATTPAAGAFTTLSASSSLSLSGGTANGVLYLNGSKVATSGTDLVFNGTSLGVGTNTIPSGVKTVIASPNTAVASRGNLYVYTTDTATADYGAQLTLGGSFSGTAEAPFAAIAGRWVGGTTGYMQFSILNSGTVAEQMRLTSTGLGIGTSSPGRPLHVASASTSYLARFQNSGSALALINFKDSTTGDFNVGVGATGENFVAYTSNTERMLLDSSGNLGIGTSSPQSGGVTVFTGTAGGATTPGVMTLGPNSTTVASGEVIGRIQFYSNDASGSSTGVVGKIDCVATSNFVGDCETALTFHTNDGVAGTAAERMRLDSSGNLGLGVTPSAWSGAKAFQMPNGVFVSANSGTTTPFMNLGANAYFDGTNWIYSGSFAATRYAQLSGAHQWFVSTGTPAAGGPISFTQAMTLDASGNLLIGRTDQLGSSKLLLQGPNATNIYPLTISTGSGSDASTGISLGGLNNGAPESGGSAAIKCLHNHGVSSNSALAFFTYGGSFGERARITSGGDLLMGATSVGGVGLSIVADANGRYSIYNTSFAGGFSANVFRYNGTDVGSIVINTTATTYNTTSDRRLKQNVVPAPSASDVIDAIQIVSHDWKAAPDEHVTYGVIAQDLHAVAPEAVTAGDDRDEIEKAWGVDYSKLVPMLIKEIQSLRARLAALESN